MTSQDALSLKRLEDAFERFCTLDKIPTEDKILLSRERRIRTTSEIVDEAMNSLQGVVDEEQVDLVYDVIFDAVAAALESTRG